MHPKLSQIRPNTLGIPSQKLTHSQTDGPNSVPISVAENTCSAYFRAGQMSVIQALRKQRVDLIEAAARAIYEQEVHIDPSYGIRVIDWSQLRHKETQAHLKARAVATAIANALNNLDG